MSDQSARPEPLFKKGDRIYHKVTRRFGLVSNVGRDKVTNKPEYLYKPQQLVLAENA